MHHRWALVEGVESIVLAWAAAEAEAVAQHWTLVVAEVELVLLLTAEEAQDAKRTVVAAEEAVCCESAMESVQLRSLEGAVEGVLTECLSLGEVVVLVLGLEEGVVVLKVRDCL